MNLRTQDHATLLTYRLCMIHARPSHSPSTGARVLRVLLIAALLGASLHRHDLSPGTDACGTSTSFHASHALASDMDCRVCSVFRGLGTLLALQLLAAPTVSRASALAVSPLARGRERRSGSPRAPPVTA